jgi:hypothetical protein
MRTKLVVNRMRILELVTPHKDGKAALREQTDLPQRLLPEFEVKMG